MPRTVVVVLAHQGVGHLTDVLLTLHNLMGAAGIYVKQKKHEKWHALVQKSTGTLTLCQRNADTGVNVRLIV